MTSENHAEKAGQLLHMDLCGPLECTSIEGAKYLLMIKDDLSRFRKVFFLKSKTEAVNKIQAFLQAVKINPVYNIEIIRTDNGKKFEMEKLTVENGIQHQTSVVHTPEQNGCAEREMRTIVEAARTMLIENIMRNEL